MPPHPSKRSKVTKNRPDLAQIIAFAQVTPKYRNFDLVWARQPGYPWWPAILTYDYHDLKHAGIKVKPINVPPPKHVKQADGTIQQIHFCLLLFLDNKFDVAIMKISNDTIQPFAPNYDRFVALANAKSQRKHKAKFNEALKRARELFHVGDNFPNQSLSDSENSVIDIASDVSCDEDAQTMIDSTENDSQDHFESENKKVVGWKKLKCEHVSEINRSKTITSEKSKKRNVNHRVQQRYQQASIKQDKAGQLDHKISRSTQKKGKHNLAKAYKQNVSGDNVEVNLLDTTDSQNTNFDSDKASEFMRKNNTSGVTSTSSNIHEDGASLHMRTPLSNIWAKYLCQENKESHFSGHEPEAIHLDFPIPYVWDTNLFTTDNLIKSEFDKSTEYHSPAILSAKPKRAVRSVQQTNIRQSLFDGVLHPHTMVQCEQYDTTGSPNESKLPPYEVHVHPDVSFICDLHAHLATCEIIGFLGGRYDSSKRILYIQAAFPCRSLMIDGDDGSTDVEMDPESEIELRDIITKAKLEVVGWYHSHPAFAPDPSVRDIENQASYQQLFQRKEGTHLKEPFVGLIVGTYDPKRTDPISLFRYFHVRQEKLHARSTKEVSIPYEIVPLKAYFRSVQQEEETVKVRRSTIYPTVYSMLFSRPNCANDNGKVNSGNEKSIELKEKVIGCLNRIPETIRESGSDEFIKATSKRDIGVLNIESKSYVGVDTKTPPTRDHLPIKFGSTPSSITYVSRKKNKRKLSHPVKVGKDEFTRLNGSSQIFQIDMEPKVFDKKISKRFEQHNVDSLLTEGRHQEGNLVQTKIKSEAPFDGRQSCADLNPSKNVCGEINDIPSVFLSNPYAKQHTDASNDNPESVEADLHMEMTINLESSKQKLSQPVYKELAYSDLECSPDGKVLNCHNTVQSIASNAELGTSTTKTNESNPQDVNIDGIITSKKKKLHAKRELFASLQTAKTNKQLLALPLLNEATSHDPEPETSPLKTLNALKYTSTGTSIYENSSNSDSPCKTQQTPSHKFQYHYRTSIDMLYKLKNVQISPTKTTKKANMHHVSIPSVKNDFQFDENNSVDRQVMREKYLISLRDTQLYGREIQATLEQAIALIDYYAEFNRRTNLHEIWRNQMCKWEKLKISTTNYFNDCNIPVRYRKTFIDDLLKYIFLSWGNDVVKVGSSRRRKMVYDENKQE